MRAPVIIDMFRTIVEKVATQMNQDVTYMHGHPKEITDVLTLMSQNPTSSAKKYPLIALFQDFEEDNSTDYRRVRLQMIIATLTDRNLLAPDRYDVSFRPVLYPIYEEMLNQIARSGYFSEATIRQIRHIKIDRLYWGRQGLYGSEKNIFNDYIDCIELKELTLNVKPLNNCT